MYNTAMDAAPVQIFNIIFTTIFKMKIYRTITISPIEHNRRASGKTKTREAYTIVWIW